MNANDLETSLGLLSTAVFIILIYLIVMPRKYCIMEDKIRIVLGRPFALNIAFKNIETARKIKGIGVGVNLLSMFNKTTIKKHILKVQHLYYLLFSQTTLLKSKPMQKEQVLKQYLEPSIKQLKN